MVLVGALCCVRAFAPPPVFEHKAERNYKATNCEACQAAIKQALRKMPKGAVDLSTQKTRRAREQKVSQPTDWRLLLMLLRDSLPENADWAGPW